MYAVIENGSRQHRVQEGDVVRLDYRDGDEPGSAVALTTVLLYKNGDDTRIGQPFLTGVKVTGEVIEHESIKVRIQKFKRRKNYRRLKGHRQWYTSVRIKAIEVAS